MNMSKMTSQVSEFKNDLDDLNELEEFQAEDDSFNERQDENSDDNMYAKEVLNLTIVSESSIKSLAGPRNAEPFNELELKKVYSSIKEKTKTKTVSLTREEIDTDVKSQVCDLLCQMKHKNVLNFIEAGARNIQLLDQVMKEKMQKIDL